MFETGEAVSAVSWVTTSDNFGLSDVTAATRLGYKRTPPSASTYGFEGPAPLLLPSLLKGRRGFRQGEPPGGEEHRWMHRADERQRGVGVRQRPQHLGNRSSRKLGVFPNPIVFTWDAGQEETRFAKSREVDRIEGASTLPFGT